MRFKVIVASYDSMAWLPGTLNSIRGQENVAVDVCVVDDASPDKTQAGFIKEYCESEGWSYILNDERMGAMRNQVVGIREMGGNPEDVIVWVDGDDELQPGDALSRLQGYYGPTTDMTYGSYESVPFSPTCPNPCEYPLPVIAENAYRKWTTRQICFNHLRTMRYRIFDAMDEAVDFRWPDGRWFGLGADIAMMVPALELSGGRHKFIEEKLYRYNSENPISDWRVNMNRADNVHRHVLSLPPKQPLEVFHYDP